MSEEAVLRESILSLFRSHCMGCSGSCCSAELEDVFIAFDWEVERLPDGGKGLVVTDCRPGMPGCVKHISFEGDRCPFSGSRTCSLSLDTRPLDCLTHPVYPEVTGWDDNRLSVSGLRVRKSCHRAEQISGDNRLLGAIKEFWDRQVACISPEALGEWLSDSEYLSEENTVLRRF